MTYHRYVVAISALFGTAVLVIFRSLMELGYSPAGSRAFAGLPIEYGFLAWFLALLALVYDRWRLGNDAARRVTLYEWWLGIIGVTGLVFMAVSLHEVHLLASTSWAYIVAAACVVSVFLSAASVSRVNVGLPDQVLWDVTRIMSRPTTWLCAVAAIGMMAFAPRSGELPTGGRAFLRWYSRQSRVAVPAEWKARKVTLVEFVDYQCPVCRQAELTYAPVLRQAEQTFGGAFGFLRIDFPLENECNPLGNQRTAGLHLAACEAAAAVRLARQERPERERAVADWLWAHQSELTKDVVFDGIAREFGLPIRQRYKELLPEIANQAAQGRKLEISGTPTFFLNGRRLPMISAPAMTAAIAAEFNDDVPEGIRRDR